MDASHPTASQPIAEITPEEAEHKSSWIIRFSIFNPYSIIVMVLFIIVIGGVCLWGEKPIPIDLLPAYRTPAVQVHTLYPGMPAEIIERDPMSPPRHPKQFARAHQQLPSRARSSR